MLLLPCVFLCLGLAAFPRGAAAQEEGRNLPVFTNVTAEAGIDFLHNHGRSGKLYFPETVGSGVAWIDYDGDGWLDLYLTNGAYLDAPEPGNDHVFRNALYRNLGDGTFADVTDAAGVGNTDYSVAATAADYDNDGDADLFVSQIGPNLLYRNNGDGTFAEVGAAAGVNADGYHASAAFFDTDADGHLDLYVTGYITWAPDMEVPCTRIAEGKEHPIYCAPQNYKGFADRLYHNNGDGTFTDVSAESGIGEPRWNGLGVVASDLDNDGDTDVYVGNDASPNLLWINQGDGTFLDDALFSGTGYSNEGLFENGMGVAAGDYNRDGLMDIAVNNFQMQPTTIYRNLGNGAYEYASFDLGIARVTMRRLSWGLLFLDYDNDGWLDLYSANGHIYENINLFSPDVYWEQEDLLFRNRRGEAFEDVSATSGPYFSERHPSRGSAMADYDNDGDLDVALNMNNNKAILLRNDGGNGNHWLGVGLRGTTSNRDGVGARLELETEDGVQVLERRAGESFAGSNDPRVHFGLGEAAKAKRLTVRWPSGTVDTLHEVAGDEYVVIVEGGSTVAAE